jgi:transposase
MTYDKTTQAKILAHAQATTISEAAQKFSVSRLSIYRWRTELEADYVKPERKAFFHKLNPTEVKAYVESNPNQTCAQIGEHFGASDVGVLKCLKKLGFSFKKRSFSTQNEMKPNEQNIKKN